MWRGGTGFEFGIKRMIEFLFGFDRFRKRWKDPEDRFSCSWKERYLIEQKWEEGKPQQKLLRGHTASVSCIKLQNNLLCSGSGKKKKWKKVQ